MRVAEYDAAGPRQGILRITERPDPRPGADEVRVRIHVSGVNPTDVKARVGKSTAAVADGTVIPHHDGAGIVDAVGEGVEATRVGQRVWVYHAQWGGRDGTAAQYCVLPAHQAVPLPDGVALTHGAALGIPTMTAHHALFVDGPIGGRTVLVQGGAGAVGHAAVQFANAAGARVLATVSSAMKAELAMEAGADAVIDYRREDVVDRIRDLAPDGVDRILEVDLDANLAVDGAVLARGGTIVSFQRPKGPLTIPATMPSLNAVMRYLLVYTIGAAALDRAVTDITAALEHAHLRPLPLTLFPLEQIGEAHTAVAAGPTGRILVTLP